MKLRSLHRWDLTPRQAVEVQRRLRDRVESTDRVSRLRLVAGVDVGIARGSRTARAAVAVLSWPELDLVEHAVVEAPVRFPYVPGLLSFREVPVVGQALESLASRPDLILCDGQGYAHPRRFGLACHLGLLVVVPTVGVAKSRLVGTQEEPEAERGASRPLLDGDEVLGTVLRTRTGVKPLYVSVGHRISLQRAVSITLQAAPRTRLPETTRWAHRLASG